MNEQPLFHALADPKRAALLGAAGGAAKGLLVGAVVGKWLAWMSLGAALGAVCGYGLARLRRATASEAPAAWEAA
ncbi:MAG: hypothetical protein QJR02_10715 [Sinobacteraceae bacterium]|nr:hypothetical protein [Nevskia sp.]MDI3260156.1 hypothetical protein [Nevskiaceae bacterium]